jgi:hypothetical protein
MRRLTWILIPLALSACGGRGSSGSLTVTCGGNVALSGTDSVDVMGDTVDGRPVITFADPVNPGKTGSITVQPHQDCKVSRTQNL